MGGRRSGGVAQAAGQVDPTVLRSGSPPPTARQERREGGSGGLTAAVFRHQALQRGVVTPGSHAPTPNLWPQKPQWEPRPLQSPARAQAQRPLSGPRGLLSGQEKPLLGQSGGARGPWDGSRDTTPVPGTQEPSPSTPALNPTGFSSSDQNLALPAPGILYRLRRVFTSCFTSTELF